MHLMEILHLLREVSVLILHGGTEGDCPPCPLVIALVPLK